MNDNRQWEISEWYDLYSDSIFKYVLMMTHNYQTAEDLTQETFVKAFQNYDKFMRYSSPKTWLYKIAYNITIDHLRRMKPLAFFKDIFSLQKFVETSPEDLLLIRERSEEIYDVLGKLKEPYKAVIILRKIKSFSIEETAEILGWSESKVKSTLFRAIKSFEKEMLKRRSIDEQKVRRKSI